MNIEVIGPGCPRCKKTAKRVKQALDRIGDGIDAEVSKVEDQTEIIERGVMHTPAVAIDGEIKTEGDVPTVDQLVDVLQSA
jgi:small redox-active disulfide protein 2